MKPLLIAALFAVLTACAKPAAAPSAPPVATAAPATPEPATPAAVAAPAHPAPAKGPVDQWWEAMDALKSCKKASDGTIEDHGCSKPALDAQNAAIEAARSDSAQMARLQEVAKRALQSPNPHAVQMTVVAASMADSSWLLDRKDAEVTRKLDELIANDAADPFRIQQFAAAARFAPATADDTATVARALEVAKKAQAETVVRAAVDLLAQPKFKGNQVHVDALLAVARNAQAHWSPRGAALQGALDLGGDAARQEVAALLPDRAVQSKVERALIALKTPAAYDAVLDGYLALASVPMAIDASSLGAIVPASLDGYPKPKAIKLLTRVLGDKQAPARANAAAALIKLGERKAVAQALKSLAPDGPDKFLAERLQALLN